MPRGINTVILLQY